MKQVKETRTYESRRSITSWFSSQDYDKEPIRCICVRTMQQFWKITISEKIEIVLTNWNVKESVKVVPTKFLADFDGKTITITPPQHDAITHFLNMHGKCFMYINVIDENGKKTKVKKI